MVSAALTVERRDLLDHIDRLTPAYMDYCRNVSKRQMAICLPTAALLWWTCEQSRALRVCDLGSGFTSYVLARYAAEADHRVTVCSVDDMPEWLDKTRAFLARHRLPTDAVMTYDDWLPWGGFDVIIHDFNGGEIRNQTMWTAAERLAPGGTLIFDDAQNKSHREEMGRVADAYGLTLCDVKAATTDESGRFAVVAR